MLDALSKLPSGILEGNLKDIGMYDECVGIEEPINNQNLTIRGRHCMYVLSVITENKTIPFTLSACVSQRCDETDLINYLNGAKFLNKTVTTIVNKGSPFQYDLDEFMQDISVQVTGATCTPVDQEIWTLWFTLCV